MAEPPRGRRRAQWADQRHRAGLRRAAGEGARRAHRARPSRGGQAPRCGEPDALLRDAGRIPSCAAAAGPAHRGSTARAGQEQRGPGAAARRARDLEYAPSLGGGLTMNMQRMLLASAFAAASASAVAAPTILRASHQFPGGRGDVRDEMVQIIAKEAKAANVELEVQVYPGASLFKANDQWNALVNGQLDISSFPLDYASGKQRAFGATLMPGLVRSHDRAQRMNNSPFMKEIKAQIDKAGVVVLADAWLAGAIASKRGCIRKPDDIKGLKVRSAGPTFAAMWQAAGASIVSIPSNEVYNALQTGVADATDTSSGSFVSFRIYEQVKCLTAPGDNALWFMYEPVLMSKKSFSRLNKKQQDVLLQAGKKSQQFFAEKAKGLDDEMVKAFKDHKVEVITLTPQEYDAWVKVAEKSSYAEFDKEVPNGKKLIDEALSVK